MLDHTVHPQTNPQHPHWHATRGRPSDQQPMNNALVELRDVPQPRKHAATFRRRRVGSNGAAVLCGYICLNLHVLRSGYTKRLIRRGWS